MAIEYHFLDLVKIIALLASHRDGETCQHVKILDEAFVLYVFFVDTANLEGVFGRLGPAIFQIHCEQLMFFGILDGEKPVGVEKECQQLDLLPLQMHL